tara:strand:- start:1776 stop:2207 length:432 start_codon:yes stop_codon:yes gene_type:complete
MKSKIKILIMGLPGSGKTTLAKQLSEFLKADWFNADEIRTKYNDYDFSYEGIIRQVNRMKSLANKSKKNFVIVDFVCPLNEQREIFRPSIVIWMDTIKKGRYSNMNKMFKPPKKFDLRITSKNIKNNFSNSVEEIIQYIGKLN